MIPIVPLFYPPCGPAVKGGNTGFQSFCVFRSLPSSLFSARDIGRNCGWKASKACLVLTTLVWVFSLGFCIAQDAPVDTATSGAVDIPLSKFAPRSKLRTPVTDIRQAAFPVIDVHTHFKIRIHEDPEALDNFVQVMDRNQIAICVSLDGTLGEALDRHLKFLWGKYESRFAVFANIDWQGRGKADSPETWACNQPDFVRNVCEQLGDAKKKGISGLKIFKQLGLGYKNPDKSFIAIDDVRFDPIWHTCGELGIPVIMHTGDPSAFFDPIDEHNERLEELSRHPDWAFPPDRFPSRDSLLAARNNVIARHRQTTFVAAHLGNDAEDLEQTSRWLEEHPNLYVEIASRISELGRQPYSAHAFLEKYADRVLFGTDGPWAEERLRLYWRFLETRDQNFPYSEKAIPPQGLWRIHGVGLSRDALKNIYFANAVRIIPGLAEKLTRQGIPIP
jgi:predicted TIM-barrel fold metal-dependent hydrolase